MSMKWAPCAVFLFAVPAFAQSNGPTFAVDRTSVSSVHQYVAAAAIPTQLVLPPNLTVTPMYRPVVESMLRHSSTFRRQCLRIAGEPRVSVAVNLAAHARRPDTRAKTAIVRRPSGHVLAVIEIYPLQDNVELIAHEIEHVIEQLDEVDLVFQASLPDTGVRALQPHDRIFETRRALRMGVTVAEEVRASIAGR